METCHSVQELESILESVQEEINFIKAKEFTGDCNQLFFLIIFIILVDAFKQQLSSLEFTESLIKRQMLTLANKPEVNITNNVSFNFLLHKRNFIY